MWPRADIFTTETMVLSSAAGSPRGSILTGIPESLPVEAASLEEGPDGIQYETSEQAEGANGTKQYCQQGRSARSRGFGVASDTLQR